MFSFNFASKMLNTIMGTEEQAAQPGQQQMGGPGQPGQQQSMIPGQAGMRPMGGGFPQVRPTPQALGASPRPGFPGPPTFSGPRPSPGVRAGPPSFGGPPRPTVSTMGTPHRFNGPQPPPSQQQQQPQQQQQQQHPQQQQQHPQQQQQQYQPQQQQQQPMPGQMPRGMPQQMPGMGRAPSPGQRPRGPGPGPSGFIGPGANQPRPPGAPGPAAPVPDVDLSHLSAEERAMIENVMAKAQQLEQGPPPPAPGTIQGQMGSQRMMRPEAQQQGLDISGGRLCPLCRQRDIIGRDGIPGQECTECRTIVCNRCGGMSPHPETKRPEWTCGNCINKRRRIGQGPMGNIVGPPSHLQQNVRPVGPYGQQPMQTIDPDGGRRGSGVGLQGGPQQQAEREFDKIEAKEMMIGTWDTDTTKHHHRRPSFEEIFSPERAEQSEELYESPSGSPVDVEFNYPPDPYPDHTLSMSTPFSASASQAKPSFVTNNKLHSRSISIDMAEQQEGSLSPPQNGFDYPSVYDQQSSFLVGGPSTSTFISTATTTTIPSTIASTSLSDPSQAPPMDEKASALMEELSKLQSAVDSTLKRRQRQKLETEEDEGDYRVSSPIRSRSPSPSPSPRGESPVKSGGSLSPLQFSSHRLEIQSPDKESPESPDVPGPRKAIVLKEHDLDDYKSSTDEESESDDSDEDRKGMVSGEVYYDHSPGEVYTIPEEEDEGGSPTGGDLVTSLKRPGIQPPSFPGDMGSPRRRMMGQEMQPGLSPDQRSPLRPQLRPQRSLDNRLPSTQPQMDMSTGQPMDQQGNIYATNNNVNTQAVSHSGIGSMDNQGGMSQSILATSMGVPISSQQSAMMGGVTSTTSMMSAVSQQQPQQQSMYGSTMAGPETQLQSDMMQRSTQQPQQLEQSGGDNQGVGVNVSDWNNMTSQQTSMMGPTSGVSVSSTDQSMQSYQQHQANSTYSQLPTSSGQSQMTQLQQSQQTQQQTTSQTAFPQSQQTQQSQQSSFPLQQQQGQTSQQQQQPFLNQPLQTQPLQSQQQFPSPLQQNQQQQQPNLQSQQLQNQQNIQMPNQQTLTSQQQPVQQQMQGQGMQSQQLQQLQTQQALAQQLAAQQQTWQQQSQQQSTQMYDQSGRLIPTSMSLYSQTPTQPQQAGSGTQHPDQYQQAMNLMQYQQQGVHQGVQPLGVTGVPGHGNVPIVHTSQAGPGAKSISGLLADFSRALGLGSTSPRPSPSEDKSLTFPISSSSVGMTGQPLSPYDPYQQQQIPQQHQQSAFASIPDSYQRQNQQLSYLPQSSQTGLQSHMGAQNLQYGSGSQAQPTLVSSSQQYVSAALASQQPYQMLTQQQQQQQAGNVGVGVLGALSPAQAHMYQQQMAMQHQQQHMKKRSRGRDGSGQPVLIGGQGLTPSGMAIGALTPAVVTSLGTFIGGSPAMLGTQLIQPMAGTHGASQGFGGGWNTPVGTPRSGRDLPGGGDSSDTMSETDSQKSLRMRRKLPCLPPDQEAAPLPSTKKRDRQRTQEQFRSLSPLRMSSIDGTLPGRSYPFSSLSLSRPSASESNLRKISMSASEPVPRPGSALGLLQASSIVSSVGGKPDMGYPLNSSLFSTSSTFPGMRATSGYSTDLGTTTSVMSGLYNPSHKAAQESWNANLAELAACLPPDLRHLLNKGSGATDHDLSGLSGISGMASGLGDPSLNSGSHLPSYMRTLREQLQEERRQLLSEERRRLEQLRERDRELGARLDAVTSRAGSEGLRSRADLSRNVGISRSAGASPLMSRKLKGHRRQLSDPKLSLPFSPIQEDGDSELLDFDRISADLLRPPYKSYEYESLEDSALLQHHHHHHHRPSHHVQPQFDWDHSQSYLTSSWAAAGGVLRETAINSMGAVSEDEHFRSRVASRFLSRRNSEGETSPSTSRMTSSNREKRHHLRKHRKSRSWHPSPYVSEEEEEEEEEMMSREEKKARIKAEIARRRQQMQERGGIHNELIRIRDGSDHERHSVLKSVDQLIRDQYGRYEGPSSSYGRSLMYSGGSSGLGRYPSHGHHGLSGNVISPCASEEDRSIERIASTFRSEELYYERLGEMSPMATDSESMGSELGAPAAMPILPDMPTRSRRLLEDLGSAPIGLNEGGRGGSSSSQNMKGGRQTPTMGTLTPTSSARIEPIVKERPLSESRKQADHSLVRYPEDYGVRQGGRKLPKTKKVTHGHNVTAHQQEPEEYDQKSQTSNSQRTKKKYQFPVKRYLLTRDTKDRSLEGNGIGMKVVGGKEMLQSNGLLAAYVAKIFPEKLVDNIGEIQEGDVVLEWNGVSLDNKTFEEVSSILAESGSKSEEIEVVLRTDYNILTGKPRPAVEKFSTRNGSSGSEARRLAGSQTLYQEDKDGDYVNGTCPLDSVHSSLGNLESVGKHLLLPDSVYNDETLDPTGNESGQRGLMCNSRLVKSPSSSTEATNTSAGTSSIHQSTNLLEEASKPSHHLAIPSEMDLRKRSTSSLPPSLTDVRRMSDQRQQYPADQYGRKGSENMSIKSMGPIAIGNERKHRQAAAGAKKGSHGQIQLQICHDPKASILYVTVLKARLPKQRNEDGTDHVQMDPFVTVYLLPDRVLENQRRTRHVPMCCTPQWNQTMVYPSISVNDLKSKYLEVSVKNYNPTGDDDELFGKVVLYLSDDGILDEQPHSYSLRLEEKPCRRRSSQTYLKSQQTLKSTTGKKHSDTFSRCSVAGDNDFEIYQSAETPKNNNTNRSRSRFNFWSLFTPGNTDCHGTFCSIL